MTTQRLTISLPADLVSLTDKIAEENHESRSKVVASCLREFTKRRFEREMEEGYKSMAKENLEFAELAIDIAHEVLPEWE